MSDYVSKKCITLFCAVIQSAASEAKTKPSARRFFEDHHSPFWEYCDYLNLNGEVIAEQVLTRKLEIRRRARA